MFPRFEKAGKLADLTAVLRRQHLAGRAVTAQITQLARARLGCSAITASSTRSMRSRSSSRRSGSTISRG